MSIISEQAAILARNIRELEVADEKTLHNMICVSMSEVAYHTRAEWQDHNTRLLAEFDTALRSLARARGALRVLFNDYKQLADSGDAGNWRLEDQAAGQTALQVLSEQKPGGA